MALVMKNGVWHWRKMVGGVMFNRLTKTDDKKFAETLARKWEYEAVQAVSPIANDLLPCMKLSRDF
jgi:hypothetical protein